MKFYSKVCFELFVLSKQIDVNVMSKTDLDTKIERFDELTAQDWRRIKKLQGGLRVSYLKYRYGSPETYVLCSYADDELVHIEWIVPPHKLKSRYPFLPGNSYSVISGLTLNDFRGLGIYPSQIQKVMASSIGASQFYIWAASDNIASLKGIRKAGGAKIGEFVQTRWLWGGISNVSYSVEEGIAT